MRERIMQTNLDERPYIEHFDGHESVKVPPLMHHAVVGGAIAHIIETAAGERGFLMVEPHMHLDAIDGSDTVFVPDVAYVSNERLRRSYPGDNVVPPFAPDIAVEVRSPDTASAERERKVAKYLACGALLVLDVDPDSRTITAYAAGSEPRHYAIDEQFEHTAVDWLRFDIAQAFSSLTRFEELTKPQ